MQAEEYNRRGNYRLDVVLLYWLVLSAFLCFTKLHVEQTQL